MIVEGCLSGRYSWSLIRFLLSTLRNHTAHCPVSAYALSCSSDHVSFFLSYTCTSSHGLLLPASPYLRLTSLIASVLCLIRNPMHRSSLPPNTCCFITLRLVLILNILRSLSPLVQAYPPHVFVLISEVSFTPSHAMLTFMTISLISSYHQPFHFNCTLH